MATHIHSLTIFILLVISANGAKLKAISRATSDSYLTNYNDGDLDLLRQSHVVLGLGILVNEYASLQLITSTADPCADPVWSWIECNTNSTPRVIALNLNGVILYQIPDDFTALDALQRIDFSQTGLYGTIPSFLGTFPDLVELNLADNILYGTVPASLCNNKKLKLTVFGNSQLSTCSSSSSSSSSNTSPSTPDLNFDGSSGGSTYEIPSTRPKKKSNTPKILGGTISAFVVMFLGVGGFAVHRHKAKTAAAVAQASAGAGPTTDPKANIPAEEVPMHAHPNHTTP